MDIGMEIGQQIIDSQNFSKVFGTKVTVSTKDMVELTIPIGPHLFQQFGFVHGGAIAYAVDNVLTYAGALALGANVLTSEYKINFLRPVIGETLIARGSIIYAGKTQAVVKAEIFFVKDGLEKICAVAQGTIIQTQNVNK